MNFNRLIVIIGVADSDKPDGLLQPQQALQDQKQ